MFKRDRIKPHFVGDFGLALPRSANRLIYRVQFLRRHFGSVT
jgi:hypothetical protein